MADFNNFRYGAYARDVSGTAEAARACNNGLNRAYAFNHEDAIRCFEQALRLDASCAFAYWGIAYCNWMNYNNADLDCEVAAAAREHAAKAVGLKGKSDVETALIDALVVRVGTETFEVDGANVAGRNVALRNREFATAMAGVHERFPDDPDVVAIFVESLMNLQPWNIWVVRPEEGLQVGEARKFALVDREVSAADVLATLVQALKANPDHLGLRHFWIHFLEQSPEVERAREDSIAKEFGGNPLVEICPDAGHLCHMPSHADIICGEYAEAMRANELGIAADKKYAAFCIESNLSDAAFYTLYRCHNVHFLVYAAMFEGKYTAALDAAHQLVAMLPASLLEDTSFFPPTGAAWLESFVPTVLHVLVRFGKWDALLADDCLGPSLNAADIDGKDLYACTSALLHYARGLAQSVLAAKDPSRISDAEREQKAFDTAAAKVHDQGCALGFRMLFNNSMSEILRVAESMLQGEIQYRKGSYEEAFTSLRKAVELDDSLPYDEPWGWMQPARHALGALLLEQGQAEEAETVYKTDLGLMPGIARSLTHPKNVWALQGLTDALKAQGKTSDFDAQLQMLKAKADVNVHASCLCAREK